MLFLEEKMPSVKLACAAATLIAGEALGFTLQCPDGVWVWMACIGGTAFLAAYGWGVRRLLFPMIAFVGLILALRTESALKYVLNANAGVYGPRPILELPVEGDVNYRKNEKKKTSHADFQSHIGPISLKVIVPIEKNGVIPRVGEIWRIDGWISQKQDMLSRYARRKLWVSPKACAQRVSDGRINSALAGWNALGVELARRAGEGLAWTPELAELNRAILLGHRSSLSRDRKRIFADAGTIHVFAISGLHVMVMAWLICSGLKMIGISANACGLISLPLVWGYVVLTGARPSAVRAAMMATLMLIAPAFGRRADPLAAWSVTALGVYSLFPERLFDIGCALSFVVMFGIVFWCHWSAHFRPWFSEGSWLRDIAGNFGVSFAAWVAGVPLAAMLFGRFTPGGLLANLVVIICAKWMVRFGTSALLISFICLPLGAVLNNVTAFWTWCMAYVSELVAMLPFSNFEIMPWSIWGCCIWYLFWFAVLMVLSVMLPRRCAVSKRWW